ncbi:ABC-type nitrate/sulfonate/bicarbonate transport system, periplasmic component [Desulfitobacterium dichloroeliminans LMG P-21439]|uniref:ABC-type nitrate/sulfonate/bicarbonate transport system, periplasmic component n=1 Tax=Desulfitobacterium dichloroeliminans (strain LMG P-21439 / DCA1) TaxID=871963 RepID=L0F7U0_DESDL|nr:ABC transporter substrate-binding protein [Desulfitobacterium dichloroeliminans]AGA69267.1 ABC-type nitrate/sulfonate/bicarbonate transport system, periplasmic component [Desulfitobacterium dichloroeliminans LMG P-21439]
MARKSMATLLAIFLVLTLVAGCGQSNGSNTGGSQPTVSQLKIGSLTIEENLPILVAQQEGYFTEQNIQVELVPFQSPVELQSAFQAGQLDGTITDIMIAALLKSSGEDLRVTSIALGATPEEGRFAIVASPKSTIQSVQDLNGKKIGISTNSIIEYVTDGLLLEGGVNPSEVKKTTVAKLPLRVEMLLSNQIDAIVVPDPLITYVVSEGAKIIAEDSKGENLSQSVTIVNNKVINEKKDALNRYYQAYTKAVQAINQSPDKYKELLVKNVNIPESIAESYKVQHYSEPQLPEEKDVDKVLNWLKSKDLLKNPVDYQSFVQSGLY